MDICNYKLSICIPTYNRAKYLESLLNCIMSESSILEYVQICISDNNSTDNTYEVVERFSMNCKNIKYHKNIKNFGFDYNLCNVINMADGDYLWILSDDDTIVKNMINNILSIIKKYDDLSIIFLKPEFMPSDKVEEKYIKLQNYQFNYNIYENKEEFLEEINWLVSFMSSFILNKNYIGDNIGNFIGSGFIHMPMIFNCLISKSECIVTNNISILCRQNNSGGYNIYKYFGENFKSIIRYYYKNGYNKKTIKLIETEWLRKCVYGNVIKVKSNKLDNYENKNKIRYLINAYKLNIYFLIRILPILLIPNFIFKPLYKFYNKIYRLIYID